MATTYPSHFPELPAPAEDEDPWSLNVHKAYDMILDSFQRASQLLRQEDGDALRLRVHSEQIMTRIIPILDALDPEVHNTPWTIECAQVLAGIVVALETAAASADGFEEEKIERIRPVHILHTGRRGRPRKVVNGTWLADALSARRKISLKALAEGIDMHPNTLRAHMRRHGVYRRFSEISDADLDILVRHFKKGKTNSGLRYVIGFLKKHGIRVQKMRIRSSLRRIDGLGQVLRNHHAINRRVYKVPRSNYMWHTDGHHKLIRWGIVIHGFVDGFCRSVIQLRASSNNRAQTVLELFLNAIQEYGVPVHVRGDRGGENVEVAIWIIRHRGPNRAAFMWGSSTRNTRIERLWGEVGSQFARRWRAFFTRLERLHRLDSENPAHLWLLHILFLGDINSDCDDFRQEWNHHPISGPSQDQTPSDMRFMSELTRGKYVDEFKDVHPDILSQYLGVDDGASSAHEGLDHDIDAHIAAGQEHHIRHEPIPVPDHRKPFDSAEGEAMFFDVLNEIATQKIVPAGFGVDAAEWSNHVYPEGEDIKYGRAGNVLSVALPFEIWWPRAVYWAQGLDAMTKICLAENGEYM